MRDSPQRIICIIIISSGQGLSLPAADNLETVGITVSSTKSELALCLALDHLILEGTQVPYSAFFSCVW